VLLVQAHYIQPLPSRASPKIAANPKYRDFFSNCVGAMDGTHIPVTIQVIHQKAYRDRNGNITQNVLACCDFDMRFTYVLVGWEGSAHDGRLYRDALTKGLLIPPGKFILGDAGFALTESVLTPYRSTRYHLKEWQKGKRRPLNEKELFNLRHATLRNVIERAFGVVKSRFSMLKRIPSYDMKVQGDIILVCFILHNFIKVHQTKEDEFDQIARLYHEVPDQNIISEIDDSTARTYRDWIASNMWTDYETYLRRRGY
jgi:hypothetical protein